MYVYVSLLTEIIVTPQIYLKHNYYKLLVEARKCMFLSFSLNYFKLLKK